LGVDVDASEEDIKSAYRRKAKELHPDVSKQVSAISSNVLPCCWSMTLQCHCWRLQPLMASVACSWLPTEISNSLNITARPCTAAYLRLSYASATLCCQAAANAALQRYHGLQFRLLCLQEDAEQQFLACKQAYETLVDADQRRQYDQLHRTRRLNFFQDVDESETASPWASPSRSAVDPWEVHRSGHGGSNRSRQQH
jgi:hypothetical protein